MKKRNLIFYQGISRLQLFLQSYIFLSVIEKHRPSNLVPIYEVNREIIVTPILSSPIYLVVLIHESFIFIKGIHLGQGLQCTTCWSLEMKQKTIIGIFPVLSIKFKNINEKHTYTNKLLIVGSIIYPCQSKNRKYLVQ